METDERGALSHPFSLGVVDIYCIFVLTILSWYLCNPPGPTAVINCWLLIVYFSRRMIVDCHIIRQCLALSPLLASLQHTPPRPPEHSWSPWWDCKGKCRRNELSIAAYLFFNPIHPTVDCYVTPNHRHLHRRCSITVSNMLTIADAGVGIRRAHLSSYLRW